MSRVLVYNTVSHEYEIYFSDKELQTLEEADKYIHEEILELPDFCDPLMSSLAIFKFSFDNGFKLKVINGNIEFLDITSNKIEIYNNHSNFVGKIQINDLKQFCQDGRGFQFLNDRRSSLLL